MRYDIIKQMAKYFALAGLLVAAVFLINGNVFAQQSVPQVLITWKADTYVPPGFPGKAMPTTNSLIRASVEILENGRFADLSKQTIRWYLNDKENFFDTGVGKQSVIVGASPFPKDPLVLRVNIPDYGGREINKSITIPNVQPEAIIQFPNSSRNFSTSHIQLKAVPYFFHIKNPSDLTFGWKVNNNSKQEITASPDIFNIDILPGTPNGFGVKIDLNLLNPLAPISQRYPLNTESVANSLNLIFAQ